MKYYIYGEDGDLMRIVGRQEEAEHMCATRSGWYYKARRGKRVKLSINQFEEAPF